MVRRQRISLLGLATAGLILLTGCTPGVDTAPAGSSAHTSTSAALGSTTTAPSTDLAPTTEAVVTPVPAAASTALEALATVPIKGRAPRTGYEREQFGQTWADVDQNGCDTRNDILRRDLTQDVYKPGTRDCVLLSGMLADPYSGQAIAFQRGQETSSLVQVDHVVALSNAWQTGAQQLDIATRTALANDPLNLLAVDGPLNQQKSDGDAATWLPPNSGYRCEYVARQVAVKVTYGLWVTQPEHDAIARILSSCPDLALPTAEQAAQPVADTTPAPASTPRVALTPAPAPSPVPDAGHVFYANCAAVRAAGAAPIRIGDSGYSISLDRDGDGVACE